MQDDGYFWRPSQHIEMKELFLYVISLGLLLAVTFFVIDLFIILLIYYCLLKSLNSYFIRL